MVLEKSGADVTAVLDDVDMALVAGTKRIVAIDNADASLRFTATGAAGSISNGTFLGPQIDGVTLSGHGAATFNTAHRPLRSGVATRSRPGRCRSR